MKKINNMASSMIKCLLCKIALDIFMILLFSAPYLVLNYVGRPFRRGFFCNDESINYPNRVSTISSSQLYGLSIPIAIIIIGLIESTKLPLLQRGPLTWKQFICLFYQQTVVFLCGGYALISFNTIAKYTVGRLRPNFLAVCQPDVNCSTRSPYEYIEDYRCANDNYEVRLSFFSGHSSWAAFIGIYLMMYLQARLSSSKMMMLKSLFQAIAAYLVIYIGLTRISDYKHHPSDVAVGFLFGSLFAYWTITWAASYFKSTSLDCITQVVNIENNPLIADNPLSGYSAI